jgi:DNA repair protein RadC
MRLGPSALSNVELLAIVLGSGTRGEPVVELSATLLSRFGSLEALSEATLAELTAVRGVGEAKAVMLQAIGALARRFQSGERARLRIESPEEAYREMRSLFEGRKTETLCILLRDARRAVLRKEEIGRGILNQVMIHPREVFVEAIRHRAHSLIIAHNHPSGDPTPSARDLELTQVLYAAGKVVGIPLSDHIIVGGDSYISFRQKRLLASDETTY